MRAPEGLKEKIDDLLDFVTTTTNVQVTRNEFVITAIEFYLDYLLKSDNNDSIIKNISQKKREMHV